MRRIAALFALLVVGAPLARAADTPVEPTVTPGDNLIVEGVPPIPVSIMSQIRRYAEIRSATPMSWHPVRREMLIGTRFADTYQIHRVAMPGGARAQLTFYPDNVNSASFEPTRGESFVFSKDAGGDENYQLYRQDLATGDVALLTDGKSRNTSAVWSKRGDRIAFASNARNGNDVDLWTVEPAKPGSAKLLAQFEGGGMYPLDWSPDDARILAVVDVSATESSLYSIDARTGEKTLLAPQGGVKAYFGPARFSRDGRGVYVCTDQGSEFHRLAYLDLAGRTLDFLAPNLAHDVDEFEQSRDGATIAFVVNEDGAGALHLMDARTRRELPPPRLPIGLVSGLEWHANGRDLRFALETSRSPSDAWSLDVKTGKLERWTSSETGGLNTATFSVPEPVRWTSFDGRTITGFLYRPPARFTGPRPVMIEIHGGPEYQFRPGFLVSENYLINELGVAVLYPNVRGSTGFGKAFQQLDNGFGREGSYQDVSALLDWIRTQPTLDAGRVMVGGGSYGGFMTLAVASNYADRIRCAFDVVGPSNFVTFLEHTSGYRRDLRRVEYGDERDPKMREFLERIAPANHADRITKPLFVVQGANDPRVPRTESVQMVANIRKVGTTVWYLEAKDEGHGFGKRSNQDFLLAAAVMFMQKYLLN